MPLVVLSVALIAAGIGLFVYATLGLVVPERTTLRHLSYYDTADGFHREENGSLAARILAAVGYVAAKRGFTGMVVRKLERAAVPLRANEAMFLHLLFVVTVSLVVRIVGGSTSATILAVLLAAFGPVYALELLATRRSRAFQEQLPDVLGLLAGSLRAGYGLMQAIELVVQEMLPPASTAFARVQAEARLGLGVEDALSAMAERLDSDDARWVVSAINIQREVGGNLAEVLDIVAGTIRERDALRRQVKSLTAEGRLSAVILVLLPFVVCGMMFVTNPVYMSQLFLDPLGRMMCLGGVVLLAVGIVWIRQASTIKV